MKRITPIEIGVLLFAAALFVMGFIWLVWPREMAVGHATNDAMGWPGGFTEFVSRTGSRIYGIMGMLLGAGMAVFTLCRGKT
jgi:hypothetical protein